MINAAITDGDWVVIRRQPEVENGEIVAAMIDGEATVKTFKRSGGHIWLIPHSPAHTPILGDDAVILGRVVAVLRQVTPAPQQAGREHRLACRAAAHDHHAPHVPVVPSARVDPAMVTPADTPG